MPLIGTSSGGPRIKTTLPRAARFSALRAHLPPSCPRTQVMGVVPIDRAALSEEVTQSTGTDTRRSLAAA